MTDEASVRRAELDIRAQRGPIHLVFANAGVISLSPVEARTVQNW